MTRYLEKEPMELAYFSANQDRADYWCLRLSAQFGFHFSIRRFGVNGIWGVFHHDRVEADKVRAWVDRLRQ